MIYFHCDRCGKLGEMRGGIEQLPNYWLTIRTAVHFDGASPIDDKKHLCGECNKAFDQFMQKESKGVTCPTNKT